MRKRRNKGNLTSLPATTRNESPFIEMRKTGEEVGAGGRENQVLTV